MNYSIVLKIEVGVKLLFLLDLDFKTERNQMKKESCKEQDWKGFQSCDAEVAKDY